MSTSGLVPRVKEMARGLGFEVAGITSIEPLPAALKSLGEWCSSGHAAQMEYMTRRPELHGTPAQLVPSARSVISLAVNYYTEAPRFQHANRYGRVARYAWGLDYHQVVKPRLALLAREIEQLVDAGPEPWRPARSRSFVDAVPLLERAVAERAGLGFFGKNTNLLRPRGGSWYFLAEILTSLELPPEGREMKISCGSCHRCMDACPTDAFAAAYKLDSRRCISYLTIENKGPIPKNLREGVGEWVFGCDVCQDVCPFNRFSTETLWPELRQESGPGQSLDLEQLLRIAGDSEFRARFANTALIRPKRRGLLRNAAVVAANVGCTAAVPALKTLLESDPEPLIRAHAVWALSRLDRTGGARLIEQAYTNDADHMVRAEAEAVLGGADQL